MNTLRLILLAMTALILAFTIIAIAQQGFTLIPLFFGAIAQFGWQGQFNVDFSLYLVLSGIWMAWRGGFRSQSTALGVLAPPLGMLFFAPYLLYLIGKSDGDARKLLLGVHAD